MNLCELIGVIIGDGHMRYRPDQRVYQIEICGNVREDYIYFAEIADFVSSLIGKRPTLRIKQEKEGESLRLEINNKKFIESLMKKGIPCGNKTFTVAIPSRFLEWKCSKHIIRGIFETDGCIYFSHSKKSRYPTYPRIEIKSSSKALVLQITNILERRGFKFYCKKSKGKKTFSITLSGEKMLKKWDNEIGFSNMRNISKYNFWKEKGFYIPHMHLNNRLESCGDGPAATAVGF